MASAAIDPAAAAERALDAYLAADRAKPLLRFVTCGSVDDGKSTLIGRLLYDGKRLFQDQLAALESDSRRFGTQGRNLDFALLVDGLAAEREQGITIDVAYRFFASDTRKFIVADAPGHEQYTRNMATAASTADLAIVLVDATKGILAQTRRHSHIVRLLGVRHVVLAVNKMDLVGHSREAFERIVGDYAAFAAATGIAAFTPIPISALTGENVTRPGLAMRWYDGPTLVEALERAPVGESAAAAGFALPVQWVNRPDANFRGFSGTVARGTVAPGDSVVVLPGGQRSTVARVVSFDGDLATAGTGQAVTLVLADQVECAAGAVLAAPDDAPATGDLLTADLVWFDEAPLDTARRYLLQAGSRQVPARVTVDRLLPVEGLPAAAGTLAMNGIAAVTVRADMPVAALPYTENRSLGAFVLIDRESNATVAAGMIRTVATATRIARAAAPIYRAADIAVAAAALRAQGRPVTIIDDAAIRAIGVDRADHWRATRTVATMFAEAGVAVLLDMVLPPGAEPFGMAWSDAEPAPDWVI